MKHTDNVVELSRMLMIGNRSHFETVKWILVCPILKSILQRILRNLLIVFRDPSTAYLDIFDFLRTFRKELLRISVPVHRFRTRVQPSSQVNGKCDLDVSSLTA